MLVDPHKFLSRQSAPGLALYFLLAATLAWYWPGLAGGWMLDDYENLAPLSDLTGDPVSWYAVITTNESGLLGRPLAMLSFAIDQYMHGGDVWYFKYTNLMIHALCGTLVFWLTGRLLQGHPFEPRRWWLALAVTAMWLLTPMQVSTTLYIVQRMTQLSALFVFAGLLCYVIGRQNLEKNRRLAIGLMLSSFVLWTPSAVLSKENGALLPLLVFLIEMFFFGFRAQLANKRLLIAIFVVFLAIPMVAVTGKFLVDPGFVLNTYRGRDFSLTERLFSEGRVLFDYVKNLILPEGTGLGLYHDDYVKSTGLLSPVTTIISLVGWLLVMVFGYVNREKPAALLFFGIFFYLAAHSLESTIFGLELYFEHRNYLPAFGIFLSMILATQFLMQKVHEKRIKSLITLFLVALPVSHAAATYQRVLTWTSFERILISAQLSHPKSLRVHGDSAVYYYNTRNFDRAIYHLDKVQEMDPTSRPAVAIHKIIAHCLTREEVPHQEYDNLQQNLSASGLKYLTASLKTLLKVVRYKQCPQMDVDRFMGIVGPWLKEQVDHGQITKPWLLTIYLAQILEYSGKPSQAIPYLDWAAEMYPHRLESGLLKLRSQLALGDLRGAQQTLTDTRRNDLGTRPDHSKALIEYEKHLRTLSTTPNNQQPWPQFKY